MSELSPKQRRELVVSMRNSGMTFKEIGLKMGFTKTRAKQLYDYGMRRTRDNELYRMYIAKSGIDIRFNVSSRTIFALERRGITTMDRLLNLDINQAKEWRMVGPKTIREIEWFRKRVAT